MGAYEYPALRNFEMNLPVGWSMFSLPVISENASISALFPDAEVVYKYERTQGYFRVLVNDQLVAGKGYWIFVSKKLDPGKGYWILFKDFENSAEFRVEAIGVILNSQ